MQMAHVEVDKETGVIRLRKFVAVQDQGLVINPKTCKSQIYGAVIMGIATALFEQRIFDPNTRRVSSMLSWTNTNCRDWATSARLWWKSTNPTASDRGA